MPHTRKIIVAIDGYSSCGKSTLAKDLAKKLHYSYIDTGAMYRAVTLYALQHGFFTGETVDKNKLIASLPRITIEFRYNPQTSLNETYLNGENVETAIRQLYVSNYVSPVSVIKEVRQKMVVLQKQMGNNKGIVMDGRDIGTVVFPDAELKIFMTASNKIRAQRRFDEMMAKGEQISFEEVMENITKRDHIDENRAESPLRRADDAVILDNSELNPAQQLEWALEKALKIIAG